MTEYDDSEQDLFRYVMIGVRGQLGVGVRVGLGAGKGWMLCQRADLPDA